MHPSIMAIVKYSGGPLAKEPGLRSGKAVKHAVKKHAAKKHAGSVAKHAAKSMQQK